MYRVIKSQEEITAAVNPATVAMIAEVLGPIIVEILGKYWETHQDNLVDEIADEAIAEVEHSNSNDQSTGILCDLIDTNIDKVKDVVKDLVRQSLIPQN